MLLKPLHCTHIKSTKYQTMDAVSNVKTMHKDAMVSPLPPNIKAERKLAELLERQRRAAEKVSRHLEMHKSSMWEEAQTSFPNAAPEITAEDKFNLMVMMAGEDARTPPKKNAPKAAGKAKAAKPARASASDDEHEAVVGKIEEHLAKMRKKKGPKSAQDDEVLGRLLCQVTGAPYPGAKSVPKASASSKPAKTSAAKPKKSVVEKKRKERDYSDDEESDGENDDDEVFHIRNHKEYPDGAYVLVDGVLVMVML